MISLATLKSIRTLLVDDDDLLRDSMQVFFRCQGYELVAVESAEQGLRAVENQKFDVVISDYMLPGADGLRFFKQLEKTHPDAIKVLITAYADEDLISRSNQLGVHEIIQKPFTAEILQESMLRLISHIMKDEPEHV